MPLLMCKWTFLKHPARKIGTLFCDKKTAAKRQFEICIPTDIIYIRRKLVQALWNRQMDFDDAARERSILENYNISLQKESFSKSLLIARFNFGKVTQPLID